MVEGLKELAAASGRQVLLATHSTEILRHAEPKSILELTSRDSPKFLSRVNQKVGLLAGLGSDYAPRIDAVKASHRLLLVEGQFDLRVLKVLARALGREIGADWVAWVSSAGHKERKQLFIALKEEIPELVALSLRDRDDETRRSVGALLEDRTHQEGPDGFNPKKWRRRHIECYLLWPPTLAEVLGEPLESVHTRLRDNFGIAIGDRFTEAAAPDAVLDVRGKDVIASFGVEGLSLAERLPAERIPEDIVTLLDELDRLQ